MEPITNNPGIVYTHTGTKGISYAGRESINCRMIAFDASSGKNGQ